MHKVLLIGCGVMGEALRKSWEKAQLSFEVTVIDPSHSQWLPDIASLPDTYSPHIIVFAVKPQVIPAILPFYVKFSGKGCIFLSVAAGITLGTYHNVLGKKEMIIRAMPNIAVTVGHGMTVLVTHSVLAQPQQSLVQAIFDASSQIMWIEDESLLAVVTALSGSGPAYFFALAEALAQAGIEQGLPEEAAMLLARQTAVGAGSLLQGAEEDSAGVLRQRVTSPGGTTEAALKVFDYKHAFQKLVQAAVKAAVKRAEELSE